MLFQFGFYSSLLLIFFVHMVVYALLLLLKLQRQQHPASGWLSLFLLLSALYISPWMLGFAGWYDTQPYKLFLLYTPLQQLFAIGPVIYFYVQSLLNPGFRFRKIDGLHFIPAVFYLLYSGWMAIYDFGVAGQPVYLADGQDRDFDTWYQVAGFVSMICYFSLSIRYYIFYRRLVFQVLSNADELAFNWVRNFLLAFFSILLAKFILFTAELLAELDYISTWWYYLSFSISAYYIAITGYANAVKTKMAFSHPGSVSASIRLLPGMQESPPDGTDPEADEITLQAPHEQEDPSDPELDDWKQRIDTAMKEQEWFRDAELSLPQMARRLQTNTSWLSRCINRGFGCNFNDFVNRYRVEAVKQQLQAGEHRQQTLLSIAFDCGFNSKTTFNRAFRKQTGHSPQEFLQHP